MFCWTTHMNGGPRRVNHAAVTINDTIFTFGGYSNSLNFNRPKPIDIHVLDTVKLKWWKLVHEIPDYNCVPFQRYGHTVVAYDTKIYLWGGRNDRKACNTLFCFDTDTLKWSLPKVKGQIPAPRDGHSACIINHYMYVFGGFQEHPNQLTQDLYMLNLHTMTWSVVKTTGTPPSRRDFHTASFIGNKMYIFGGRGNENAPNQADNEMYCPEIHYFDTITNVWVQPTILGNKPPGRRSHSAFVHNGLLYIFGGFNKNMNLHFQDVNQYNPENCTWRTISPLGIAPCARRRQICIVIKNRVYISGGSSPMSPEQLSPARMLDYGVINHINDLVKDHDDLHILELNPTLKDLSLISSLKFIEEKKLNIKDDLCIPLSLKNEMLGVNTSELADFDINPKEWYNHEFPYFAPYSFVFEN